MADAELRELATRIVTGDARAVRRSARYGLVAFVAGVAWIVYAFLQVRDLGAQAAELKGRLAAQSQRLNDQRALLEKQRAEIRDGQQLLIELNPMLREFGWSTGRLTRAQLAAPEVRESLRANRALAKLPTAGRRSAIHVFYFPKDEDANPPLVIAALTELGFDVRTGVPQNAQKTNTVVFGSAVDPEGAKAVALALIRAGVPIKALYRSASRAPLHGVDRARTIQVLGYTIVDADPLLTVDQIEAQHDFEPIPL